MEVEIPTTAPSAINVVVKFGGKPIPMSLSPDSTVNDLKSHLQSITNVLPRGQKLIFKGKVLVDSSTLRQSEVGNGAKIMLMASQGLHQGEGPVLKDAETRPISRAVATDKAEGMKPKVLIDKNRTERWKATGIIALAQSNLKNIPEEVWDCGSIVRVFDVSNNFIQSMPGQISCFSSMQKLFLQGNGLSDESIQWEGIASLKRLTLLCISHNNLTTLPSVVGSLKSLRQLDVSNNKLTSLPTELGLLSHLEILKAKNNRISNIPASIGECGSLMEVDLSANLLLELPESLSNLCSLKTLEMSNTGVKSLPSALFKGCSQLSTLGLHNTEITVEFLRQYEGWDEFDKRRRTKHQKQLDFRVVNSGDFDEGADKSW
ncbi:PREDICTED: LRR repeats and ubiquitin-like domain-containing protein At2g30105 [Tarenaya hassleriana]|uniref:LRR repeats and ubiquitin-like domain-containing protein At2g30105 n=1 Tax=Tarenaya hassleriana TaxID=28532 RepID=UPI00053C53B0|nr:PREDICTED: LRR repeats and ubiquitin-like domain-containing protein At2g30105 [Tarenaya hassleriana]